MAISPLEVERQALADFGLEVTVTPATGEPYPLTMLYDEQHEDAGLGHISGNLTRPMFRCLPEDAVGIAPGYILALAGVAYKVFDVLRRHQALTEIRTTEQ